jgi:hypothetical protein
MRFQEMETEGEVMTNGFSRTRCVPQQLVLGFHGILGGATAGAALVSGLPLFDHPPPLPSCATPSPSLVDY